MGEDKHGGEAGSKGDGEGEGSGAMVPHKNHQLGELPKQERESTDRHHHHNHLHRKSRKSRRETAQEVTEKERAAGIERDSQVRALAVGQQARG